MRTGCLFSIALLASLLVGCGDDDPCEGARYGCETETPGFELDPSCELTGALGVELGDGDGRFSSLGPGERPQITEGGQGASHMYFGLRITGADLSRYDLLKVTLWTGDSRYDPETGSTSCDFTHEGCQVLGEKDIILGSSRPVRTVSDDVVEEYGLLLVGAPYVGRYLKVDVQDPCGRTGRDTHIFTWDE